MQVLLGSGGFRTPERIRVLQEAMRAHFSDVPRLLFIPYALNDHDRYVQVMVERGLHAGYELDGIHRHTDSRRAVSEAAAIYIGGGNTFRLLHALYQYGLVELLRERVRAGIPYLGISAGSNVACPTIKTTNDMPIIQPPSFDALRLVPFQINAHYYTGANWVKVGDEFREHFGETRDDRLREFHELNEAPVVGLWEGGLLQCDGRAVLLRAAPARIFRKGQPSVDVTPDAELTAVLASPAGPR
jgi:dipeptidase E